MNGRVKIYGIIKIINKVTERKNIVVSTVSKISLLWDDVYSDLGVL